jgi:hypothetical protein
MVLNTANLIANLKAANHRDPVASFIRSAGHFRYRFMRPFVLIFACLACGHSVAGRPVFHELTLEQLIASSELVVIAEPTPPIAVSHTMRTCKPLLQTFTVTEVLLAAPESTRKESEAGPKSPSSPPSAGKTISVALNPTELTTCRNEEVLQNGTGASFYAEKYRLERPTVLQAETGVLLFLRIRDGQLLLGAEGAIESLAQTPSVRAKIARQTRRGTLP